MTAAKEFGAVCDYARAGNVEHCEKLGAIKCHVHEQGIDSSSWLCAGCISYWRRKGAVIAPYVTRVREGGYLARVSSADDFTGAAGVAYVVAGSSGLSGAHERHSWAYHKGRNMAAVFPCREGANAAARECADAFVAAGRKMLPLLAVCAPAGHSGEWWYWGGWCWCKADAADVEQFGRVARCLDRVRERRAA